MVSLPIETERLVLREIAVGDWQAVHAYACDLEVVRFMPWGPNSEADTKAFIQKAIELRHEVPRTAFEMAVILKAENRLIGGCGLRVLNPNHREGVIGYCFSKEVWGNGYAPEAARAMLRAGFEALNLHRIFADCDVENTASARVMEKIGMAREGRLRENIWYKGRWRDSYRYAILETEWW